DHRQVVAEAGMARGVVVVQHRALARQLQPESGRHRLRPEDGVIVLVLQHDDENVAHRVHAAHLDRRRMRGGAGDEKSCGERSDKAVEHIFPFFWIERRRGYFFAAVLSATASRMSALKAVSFSLLPSCRSMARRVLPSRLELNRRFGSLSLAPLAKVSLTT